MATAPGCKSPKASPASGGSSHAFATSASERTAISAIPNNLIAPFLSQPLVLDANGLADSPRIVATQEGRVFVGRGDDAYARGIQDDSIINYNVFRPLRPLYDPDDKARKKPIAYEAFYLGTANKVGGGEIAKMRIDSSKQEIGVGDRLLPVEREELVTLHAEAPGRSRSMRASLRSMTACAMPAADSIVTLSRGSDEGVSIGDVLQLFRTGETKLDRTANKREFIKLPDEQDRTGVRVPSVSRHFLRADSARNESQLKSATVRRIRATTWTLRREEERMGINVDQTRLSPQQERAKDLGNMLQK